MRMPFRPHRLVRRTRKGIEVNLGPDERQLLRQLSGELRELLETDDPSLRRLFPTAYNEDPERDAAYQILARSELIDRRADALDVVAATADADVLDRDQAMTWMQAVNQVRLVLGTRLDVDEEDDFSPDDPDALGQVVYYFLGLLLEQLVAAVEP
jgi:hypothetical protein